MHGHALAAGIAGDLSTARPPLAEAPGHTRPALSPEARGSLLLPSADDPAESLAQRPLDRLPGDRRLGIGERPVGRAEYQRVGQAALARGHRRALVHVEQP